MTKKRQRTEKSKYKHQSTGDYCTCAAYIAEIMCMRNAQNKNKGSLPYKFWNTKPWDWTFKRQLFLANKVLKKYSESVVLRAINSPEAKSIFSLSNKRLISIIVKYKKIVDKEQEREIKPSQIVDNPQIRKNTFGKKTTLSKLRSLDKDGKKSDEKKIDKENN